MRLLISLCLLSFWVLSHPAHAVTMTPLSCASEPTTGHTTCPAADWRCLPATDNMYVATHSGIWQIFGTLAEDYASVRAWVDDITPGAACTGTRVDALKSDVARAEVTPPQEAMKWHPGWYPYISNFHWNTDQRDILFSKIDESCTNPAIKGWAIHKYWVYFEGSQGDYTPGFAMIDEIKAKLETCGKKLIVILEPANYGSGLPVTSAAGIYPPYVVNTAGWVSMNTTTTAWPGGLKTVAAFWKAPVMDRMIALMQAICTRYDGDSTVEMYQPIGVTSLQPRPAGTNGYSHDAAMTQLYRMVEAGAQTCAHTMLRMPADYMEHQMMVDLGNAVASTRNWAWGDFDPELPLPGPITRAIESHKSFRGEYLPPDYLGNVDLRGKVPYVAETQALGNGDCTYGNAYGIPSPQNLYDYFKSCTGSGMCASHYIILYNNWTACGTTTNRWPQWLPFITAHPDLNPAPPLNIGTVNTN